MESAVGNRLSPAKISMYIPTLSTWLRVDGLEFRAVRFWIRDQRKAKLIHQHARAMRVHRAARMVHLFPATYGVTSGLHEVNHSHHSRSVRDEKPHPVTSEGRFLANSAHIRQSRPESVKARFSPWLILFFKKPSLKRFTLFPSRPKATFHCYLS